MPRRYNHHPNHYTEQQLYTELETIAKLNHDFRANLVSAATVNLTQTERLHTSDLRDPEIDGQWPTPFITEEFEFTATRHPTPWHDYETEFAVGYKSMLSNITLPPHIAEASYGLDAIEAVENGGPSTFVRMIEFMIAEDRELQLCETATYTDAEGDELISVSSSPVDLEELRYQVESDWDDDEDQAHARGVAHLGRNAARTLEVIPNLHPVEAASFELVGLDIDKHQQDADIATALHIVGSLKRALRQQLGVRV